MTVSQSGHQLILTNFAQVSDLRQNLFGNTRIITQCSGGAVISILSHKRFWHLLWHIFKAFEKHLENIFYLNSPSSQSLVPKEARNHSCLVRLWVNQNRKNWPVITLMHFITHFNIDSKEKKKQWRREEFGVSTKSTSLFSILARNKKIVNTKRRVGGGGSKSGSPSTWPPFQSGGKEAVRGHKALVHVLIFPFSPLVFWLSIWNMPHANC